MYKISKSFQAINNIERLNAKDYIEHIFPDFIEFKGDRLYGDDAALIGGLGTLDGNTVTIIAQVRGKNLSENACCNFSMAMPEGYRKALRLMRQAEKFHRPIICFIDTIGAYPGKEAEEHGQVAAIANNLLNILELKNVIINVLMQQAGSGGALALCVADKIVALENACLSVISPKACASILWKDSSRYLEAATMLKMTANDLKLLKVIDTIIPESVEWGGDNTCATINEVKQYLSKEVSKLQAIPVCMLVKQRKKKYRHIGLELEVFAKQ